MFNDFLKTISLVYNALTTKIKLALLGLIILIIITVAWFIVRTRTTIIDSGSTNSNPSTVIYDARELIQRIGNPWQIDSKSYVNNYPFLINEKIDGDIFILDVNTGMLDKDYYKDLFKADSSIRESLEEKPLNYTDTYQILYNAAENRALSASNRILNFSKIRLNGTDKWFFEDDLEYWVTDPTPQFSGIEKVKRNIEALPPFRKLTRIGDSKFLSSYQDTLDNDIVYITVQINDAYEAFSKSGRVNFNFLDEATPPIDPLFVGAITTSNVLPDVYPLSGTKVLQKSINAQQAVITFADITNLEAPFIVNEKSFAIKEFNSIFTTCAAFQRQKCWIYNPGLKSITELDSNMNRKDIRATLDVDLTKLPDSLSLTRDKDKLLRYNNDSDELLFFYNNKWQSIYRLS